MHDRCWHAEQASGRSRRRVKNPGKENMRKNGGIKIVLGSHHLQGQLHETTCCCC